MFWVEEEEDVPYTVPDDIVDLAFTIRCKALPLDHAYVLSSEIRRVLPWFSDEGQAGLHLIHGAESGNGWYRPEDGDDILYLSRRAKLTLRLPKERVEDARAATGKTLDIAGYSLEIGSGEVRLLSTLGSVYARHAVLPDAEEEERFLEHAIGELKRLGIKFKKVLSGRPSEFQTPDGVVKARSLLVGGLNAEDSVSLQQRGVGAHRKLGCGLFIPHKQV